MPLRSTDSDEPTSQSPYRDAATAKQGARVEVLGVQKSFFHGGRRLVILPDVLGTRELGLSGAAWGACQIVEAGVVGCRPRSRTRRGVPRDAAGLARPSSPDGRRRSYLD